MQIARTSRAQGDFLIVFASDLEGSVAEDSAAEFCEEYEDDVITEERLNPWNGPRLMPRPARYIENIENHQDSIKFAVFHQVPCGGDVS